MIISKYHQVIGSLHQEKLECQTFTVFTDKFHIWCISSNWHEFQSFPIELKVVITQGFSFICFRTVEACTPY